jgi:DNA-binding NtrC family response regulator
VAGDAANAMRKIERADVDLVLCDLALPDLEGSKLIQTIRSFDLFTNLPIVVVTGSGDRSLIINSMKAGANACLIKPFDADLLDKTITETMIKCNLAEESRIKTIDSF